MSDRESTSVANVADFMLIVLTPALIIGMLSSFAMFLFLLGYHGPHVVRSYVIMFLFVGATVLIARISMEQSKEYAALFALPLAGVMFVATGFSLWGMLCFAAVWWIAHQVTWNCTWIDDKAEDRGTGLLQELGVDRERMVDDELDLDEPPPPIADERGWAAWWRRQIAKSRHERPPGVSVIYFAMIALPSFGIGHWFLPASQESMAVWMILIYLACSLGLLMATSFLGLRRYLKRRRVEMPPEVARAWLIGGTVLTLLFLAVCLQLPRPKAARSETRPLFSFGSFNFRRWNDWALGNDGESDRESGRTAQSSQPQSNSQSAADGKRASSKTTSTGESGSAGGRGEPMRGAMGNSSGQGSGESKKSKSSAGGNQSRSSGGGERSSSSQQRRNAQSETKQQGAETSSGGAGEKKNSSPRRGESSSGTRSSRDGKSSEDKSSEGSPEKKSSEDAPSSQRGKSAAGSNRPTRKQPVTKGDAEKDRANARSQPRGEAAGTDRSRADREERDGNRQSSSASASRQRRSNRSRSDSHAQSAPLTFSRSTPLELGAHAFGTLLKLLFYLALGSGVAYLLWRFRAELARGFQQLVDDLRAWWAKLFERRSVEQESETPNANTEASVPMRRRFSEYADPFRSGLAQQWEPVELVRYTFEAVEAWGAERGCEREADWTAMEYLRELGRGSKVLMRELIALGKIYGQAAYAPQSVTRRQALQLEALWRRLT